MIQTQFAAIANDKRDAELARPRLHAGRAIRHIGTRPARSAAPNAAQQHKISAANDFDAQVADC